MKEVNKYSREDSNRKTNTGFVLLRGSTGSEQRTSWEWLTQRNIKKAQEQEQQSNIPRLSYTQKKRILSGLDYSSQSSSNFKIRGGFNINQKKRISSTTSCTSLKSDRKIQPFIYLNSNQQQIQIPALNFGIDMTHLIKSIREAHTKGNRIIAVISVRRLGLRYKFNHAFVSYCFNCKSSQQYQLRDLAADVRKQMKEFIRSDRELYFYSTKGEPIHGYKQIGSKKLRVILVDSSPRLQLTTELKQKVSLLSSKIQKIIKHRQKIYQKPSPSPSQNIQQLQHLQQQNKYDHQRIKNIKKYVQKIEQNPNYKLTDYEQPQNELLQWYKQRYNNNEDKQKESDKNLLFQTKNHYPLQIVNQKLLNKANKKVENLPMTNNRHKYVAERIDIMMEHVRRQMPTKDGNNKKKQIVIEAPVTKKDMLLQLDKKNSLLTTQNVPYLIQKYGLNRFQLHNLYNLYKCFQKIAVMRSPHHHHFQNIKNKGIDRQTFQVGLKGLDMNPGDQLIKGICHFGDYISWEQFIKIISISLRKTPEEKLTAILKGISSFDTGHLSKHQISLMIGNSLQKLFDHEQPQLKQYFTTMAMTELDPQHTGQIPVEILKQKVLNKGTDNMNMVSFLILNT